MGPGPSGAGSPPVAVEALKARWTALAGRIAPEPDLVLVPTDVEGALECAVLAPRLAARGARVAIGLVWARDLCLLPPDCVDQVQVTRLDPLLPGARYVVFANNDNVTKHLDGPVARDRIVMRPTGTGVFEVFRRGVAKHFRTQGRLLLRSRLEVAELGDRGCALLPSGARYALDAETPPPSGPVLFLPAAVGGHPGVGALVTALVEGLTEAGLPPRLLGPPAAAGWLPAVTLASPRPELLRGTVIVPDTHEVALLRALGAEPVVVALGPRAELSKRWTAAHPVLDTVEAVLHRVVAGSSRELDPLVALADAGADVDAWVTGFEKACLG